MKKISSQLIEGKDGPQEVEYDENGVIWYDPDSFWGKLGEPFDYGKPGEKVIVEEINHRVPRIEDFPE